MFILNAGLSHKWRDWLMSLTTEIEKTKRGFKLRKEMLVQSKLEHCSIIESYLELQILDFSLVYMVRKLRHRPKTFRGVQDSIMRFGSPNLSIKREVWICPATHTLFSVQPISRVLEVQMHRCFFVGKLRQFSRTFMKTIC